MFGKDSNLELDMFICFIFGENVSLNNLGIMTGKNKLGIPFARMST